MASWIAARKVHFSLPCVAFGSTLQTCPWEAGSSDSSLVTFTTMSLSGQVAGGGGSSGLFFEDCPFFPDWPTQTPAAQENSEVLPRSLVAVAVITLPAGT